MRVWRLHKNLLLLRADGTVFHRDSAGQKWRPGWGKFEGWTLMGADFQAYREWAESSRKVRP